MMTISPASLREQFSNGLYLGQSISLFATSSDLEHIKAAARVILPDMQPQRRLEAVARGLRFKSYAAMKTALSRATPENPLLLQMAFGQRSEIVEQAFEEHLRTATLVPDEGGVPLSVYGYVSIGAVFLSALFASREGSLKELGRNAMFRIGFEEKIGGHHRAAALQGIPEDIAGVLRSQGAVLKLDSGVEVAPVSRIVSHLRQEHPDLLVDDLDDALDYDQSFVDFAGEGGWFGEIALNNAVFISDNETRIDVLPLGWSCSWRFSIGAVFSDWADWSRERQLEHLREHMAMLVEDFGVPEREVGIAFRLVPELAGEPEVMAAPDVATPRNPMEIMEAAYDGRAIRM